MHFLAPPSGVCSQTASLRIEHLTRSAFALRQAAVLTLTHSRDRREAYRESRRFDTTPSRPILSAAWSWFALLAQEGYLWRDSRRDRGYRQRKHLNKTEALTLPRTPGPSPLVSAPVQLLGEW
jgi:hypothetical protein